MATIVRRILGRLPANSAERALIKGYAHEIRQQCQPEFQQMYQATQIVEEKIEAIFREWFVPQEVRDLSKRYVTLEIHVDDVEEIAKKLTESIVENPQLLEWARLRTRQ